MHRKFRIKNTDVHVYEQEDEEVRLLQSSSKYPLSQFYSYEGEVRAMTNCSYFASSYVNGRNQGDEKNDTYADSENGKWCDVVFFKDGTWKAGKFNSWDYKENVVAGFSPCVLEIDGKTYYSELLDGYNTKLTIINPQTAIAITKDDKLVLIVSDGRSSESDGLSGQQIFDFINSHYPSNKLKALLDGGGSSEMIVDGEIVNNPSDGAERKMFNALALIKPRETQKAMFPLKLGAVTQPMDGATSHKGTKAIDFGWLIAEPNGDYNLYAPFDGTIMWANDISKGAAIAFQSDYPVEYADGTIDYMTVFTEHDNDRPSKGAKFKQGKKYSKMGTAGNVGKHVHLEVQKGKYQPYTGLSQQSVGKVYIFPNTIEPYNGLFMDDSIDIRKSDDPYADLWVYVGHVEPQEQDENKNQVLVDVDGLRVRSEPSLSGEYLYTCQKGYFEVLDIQSDDDYTWYCIGVNAWIAGVDGVTYLPKKEENEEDRIQALEQENNALMSAIDDLNSQIQALESEKEKLEQEYQNQIKSLTESLNTATNKLKAINDYAKEIVTLSK